MPFGNLPSDFFTNIDWLLQSHGSAHRFGWSINPKISPAFNICLISLMQLDPMHNNTRHDITSQYHVTVSCLSADAIFNNLVLLSADVIVSKLVLRNW